MVIARELTKIHEEFIRGTVDELLEKYEHLKGEIDYFNLNKEKIKKKIISKLTIEEHYNYYAKKGLEKKEIIKKIAKDRNVSKNEIYQQFINKK